MEEAAFAAGCRRGGVAADRRSSSSRAQLQAALDRYRSDALWAAADRLAIATSDVVTVLVAVATDTETPAAAHVTAASRVLDHASHYHELTDLTARLRALESSSPPRSPRP